MIAWVASSFPCNSSSHGARTFFKGNKGGIEKRWENVTSVHPGCGAKPQSATASYIVPIAREVKLHWSYRAVVLKLCMILNPSIPTAPQTTRSLRLVQCPPQKLFLQPPSLCLNYMPQHFCKTVVLAPALPHTECSLTQTWPRHNSDVFKVSPLPYKQTPTSEDSIHDPWWSGSCHLLPSPL